MLRPVAWILLLAVMFASSRDAAGGPCTDAVETQQLDQLGLTAIGRSTEVALTSNATTGAIRSKRTAKFALGEFEIELHEIVSTQAAPGRAFNAAQASRALAKYR